MLNIYQKVFHVIKGSSDTRSILLNICYVALGSCFGFDSGPALSNVFRNSFHLIYLILVHILIPCSIIVTLMIVKNISFSSSVLSDMFTSQYFRISSSSTCQSNSEQRAYMFSPYSDKAVGASRIRFFTNSSIQ